MKMSDEFIPEATITLSKRKINSAGDVAYSRAGVRSTVYINKNVFEDKIPNTITLTCDEAVFRPIRPSFLDMKEAERIQRRAEKAQRRVVKAQEIAERAVANANEATNALASL
jgi:hypothetical protein